MGGVRLTPGGVWSESFIPLPALHQYKPFMERVPDMRVVSCRGESNRCAAIQTKY